jgi:sugar/nucleoside kinase (ribokinase family)
MAFEIVGIGSALVDVTVRVEEVFLEAEGLPKGGMTLVDAQRSKELLNKFSPKEKELSPGGATANVMASFAHCGGRSAFIGKVGADEMGEYFTAETERAGVRFVRLVSEDTPTGIGLTFVTPDGERTFATHLGAAIELKSEELSPELLNQAPLLHVEAYLVFNRELIDSILDIARLNRQRISMDLSSFDVVHQNRQFFEEMAERQLDVLFANEEESRAFTSLSPRESLEVFSELCDVAVVKEGAGGSHIARGDRRIFLPAEKVQVEDTNGAGDAYAGGVLFGLCRQMDLEVCGRIGTRAGALMVSQRGARCSEENADLLREYASQCQEP